ncbi:hypothetical protein RGQ29_019181 [Quercus rubra]|uniref:Retrotransposon gag protein n=1 Tax=Quercus rubra TaxID=3512 RepID=A0AAN7IVT6_QUERU|nr:hypothetical protein RGQ29_019181 [Quercus rubra]
MLEMLEQLLKLKLIELPECKRSEEMGKVDDPNYCKYHRIISHPIQKCFVLKELIMKLAKERKINLDFNDVAQSNLATFSCGLPIYVSPTTKQGANTMLIQASINPALEDGVQATVDELKEINLGTTKEPRPTFISALLTPEEEEGYLKLLVEYKDVFAWTYKEMPGLNPSIALHHLAVKKGVRPIKQAQR